MPARRRHEEVSPPREVEYPSTIREDRARGGPVRLIAHARARGPDGDVRAAPHRLVLPMTPLSVCMEVSPCLVTAPSTPIRSPPPASRGGPLSHAHPVTCDGSSAIRLRRPVRRLPQRRLAAAEGSGLAVGPRCLRRPSASRRSCGQLHSRGTLTIMSVCVRLGQNATADDHQGASRVSTGVGPRTDRRRPAARRRLAEEPCCRCVAPS